MIKTLTIIILLILFLYIFNNFFYIENFNSNISDIKNKIPKIIHQTAPKDTNKWHKSWKKCQKSWKRKFPNFKYIMWTDEDLDNLVKKDFPFYYKIYKNYNRNIKRIDIARYMILFKYGGIYADMDFECLNNFYDNLNHNKVNLVESPYEHNETFQNSLMASKPGNPYWLFVLDFGKKNKDLKNILSSTGPRLLDEVYFYYPKLIHKLPHNKYNPHKSKLFLKNNIYTRHLLSNSWLNK